MLIVHHLGKSQSERIVWLCKELAIPFELKHYTRDPATMLAPAEFKALHTIGTAPVITDGNLVLAESVAIMEYILVKYGQGRLTLGADHPAFADYLYWYHFANGTLQPAMGRNMLLRRLALPSDNPVQAASKNRLDLAMGWVDKRLGACPYLAGDNFTAADIMTVFSLTTMRYFMPLDLAPYPNVLAYLQRIGARDAYQRAMAEGDPGMPLMLT